LPDEFLRIEEWEAQLKRPRLQRGEEERAVTRDEEMKAEGRAERGMGSAGGHKEYFEKVIEETNRRASGRA
jgi:hypothetical protein